MKDINGKRCRNTLQEKEWNIIDNWNLFKVFLVLGSITLYGYASQLFHIVIAW